MATLPSLTAREQVFAEHFAAHGHAEAAAQAAGYPPAQAALVAQTLLDHPPVRQHLHALALTHSLAEPEATLRLTQLARGTLAPFLRVDSNGQAHLDLSTEQAQANLHLLRRVVQRRTSTPTAAGLVEVVETEVELHDVVGAVDKLLQLHGAYPAHFGEVYSSAGLATTLYLPDNGRGDAYPPPTPTPEAQ